MSFGCESIKPMSNRYFVFSMFIFLFLLLGIVHSQEASLVLEKSNETDDNFKLVRGGKFYMGTEYGDEDNRRHLVEVSDFKISKYEITHAEYIEFLNDIEADPDGVYNYTTYIAMDSKDCAIAHDGEHFYFLSNQYASSDQCPVFCVTWFGAQAYCEWTGGRLPTEAEWEFAAKGGIHDPSFKFSGSNECDDVAWWRNNSNRESHPVGSKEPNGFGLYDMSGNVAEWSGDFYDEGYYSRCPMLNPKGPKYGESKVIRGGSWYDNQGWLSVTKRKNLSPYYGYNRYGFRVVKEPESPIISNYLRHKPMNTQKDQEIIIPEFIQIYKPINTKKIGSMVFVEGGSYVMGAKGSNDQVPVHEVWIDDFCIGKYEVTIAEFKEFIDATGYITDAEKLGFSLIWEDGNWREQKGLNWHKDEHGNIRPENEYDYPVIHVSWNDANAYCKWKGGRLPTEAEWEYAASGGGQERLYKYAGSNIYDQVMWCISNSNDYLHPVGEKRPNRLGLFDMSGNVWEWCYDWYDSNYYSKSEYENPKGPDSGLIKVLRGGAWTRRSLNCKVTYRYNSAPERSGFSKGFRIVVPIVLELNE